MKTRWIIFLFCLTIQFFEVFIKHTSCCDMYQVHDEYFIVSLKSKDNGKEIDHIENCFNSTYLEAFMQ